MKLFNSMIKIDKWTSATGSKKLKIEFLTPATGKALNEIKSLDGAHYEGPNLWTAKDTCRNSFSLDILLNGEWTGASKLYSDKNQIEIIDRYSDTLWKHQKQMFAMCIYKRRVINAGEMGIGKTFPTLRTLYHLRFNQGWPGSIWWIGPNSGLTALRTQLIRWNFGSLFHSGDKIKNYHSLERLMEEAKGPPQMVVFDECHALKNPSSRRTQLAMALTEEMEKKYGKDCAVIGLTGTPAPESHFDWWSICEVVRPGWLREGSFNKYKYRLAEFGRGERVDGGFYPKFLGWKQGEVSILPKRLEGLVLVTWKKDCLDLPIKIYEERVLEVSESTKRVAKALTRMGLRAIEVQVRLRQLSDGFQYSRGEKDEQEGIKRETLEGETPKDQALKDILEEYREAYPIGARLVVYAAFIASVDRCIKIALEMGWNVWRYDGRGQASLGKLAGISETVFQSPEKFPDPIVFIGNPEAAGQGLTLTPSPAIVYYSNSFKSQFRVQSEDRIHRAGATRGCKIIDLIHLPTDKLVLDAIKGKRSVEEITLKEIEESL